MARGVGGQARIPPVPVRPPIPGVSRRRLPGGAAPHPGLPPLALPGSSGVNDPLGAAAGGPDGPRGGQRPRCGHAAPRGVGLGPAGLLNGMSCMGRATYGLTEVGIEKITNFVLL